jgi:DNA-binding transcriptional LysR family regulator
VKKALAPQVLATLPFVLREVGSGTREIMEEYLTKHGNGLEALDVVAVLGSTDSVKQAVCSGLGASVVSRIAVQKELRRGELKEIRIRGLKMTRQFFVVSHKRRVLPTPYEKFLEVL